MLTNKGKFRRAAILQNEYRICSRICRNEKNIAQKCQNSQILNTLEIKLESDTWKKERKTLQFIIDL
jgi:hypothetical protein